MVSLTDLVRQSEFLRSQLLQKVVRVSCRSHQIPRFLISPPPPCARPSRHPGYLETIRNCRPNGSRWKILVVDAHTKKHLNHVLKVYDILEEGVQRESSVVGWGRHPSLRTPSIQARPTPFPVIVGKPVCPDSQ